MIPEATIEGGRDLLVLYVINAGVGESIIIKLPNEKWGVVDCYASSCHRPETNLTLQFLLHRGVQELEFLCLTHPHDDHYRGMSQLIDRFPVRFFWRFGATSPRMYALVTYLKAFSDNVETVNDLERTLMLVAQRRNQNLLRVVHMSDRKQLYPVSPQEHDLEIWGIAPSSNHIERYEERLCQAIGQAGNQITELTDLRHNQISAALTIRFGSTRILLGGDVEAEGWSDVLHQMQPHELAVDAVKVSHHGSPTGYTPELWPLLAARSKPIAIITPSFRHALPTSDAIAHIRHHTRTLMTTHRSSMPLANELSLGTQEAWTKHSPPVRAALARTFRTMRVTAHGTCTLAFDDCGNCVRQSCEGEAAFI